MNSRTALLFTMFFTLQESRKTAEHTGGRQAVLCNEFAVDDYGFTHFALALNSFGFCTIGENR
ncbi:MAG: hypothetical protein JRI76_13420 [Deltaproteobacteria bacterium]|nr:hypothetical protein [Deltaproteobacteria bacterium]MBW2043007.1 hypothetical protein [Deltaproteobacteria bacterium]